MSDPSFAQNLTIETWTLYSIGVIAISLRLIARCFQFGWRGLKIDDFVMINGLVWYTLLCVSLNQIVHGGGSNLMSPDEIAALTPAITKERIRGSKWVFFSEHCIVLTLWSMKVCMAMLYTKLTNGLKQQWYVKCLVAWIAISFVGSELALFLSCRPLAQYWAVPVDNAQCSTYQYYEIIEACMNIPGDLAMLAIAIPLLASLQLPTRQKVILLAIFGLGGFIIVAAILTKLYCLVPGLISYAYINWYFREASVAVYVTNLPAAWPLVLWMFPRLGKWGTRSRSKGEITGGYRGSISGRFGSQSRLKDSSKGYFGHNGNVNEDGDFNVLHSAEHIHKPDKALNAGNEEQVALEIFRKVTVSVDRGSEAADVEKGIESKIK